MGGVGEGRAAGAGGVGAARLVGGAAAPIMLRRAWEEKIIMHNEANKRKT